ncbi:MAG TPA: NUDIX hydrolase [Clostridia bacterium]|nr:NUDIX hydrolase [Clostridia bacterium]
MTEIQTLGSRVVYENKWMRVREDDIRRENGLVGTYGVVEKPDFAIIAAVQDGRIALVEQYRYPVSNRHWELPQGTWDKDRDDPLGLAKAELREETGIVAKEMTHVGFLYLAYGFCTQGYNVFLARDLEEHEPQREAEEHGLISAWFDLEEVDEMIRTGKLVDASTVAALGLIRTKGLL